MTYRIVFLPGYSAVDHFGEEIAARVEGETYPTRRQAEERLARVRRAHSQTHRVPQGSYLPRLEVQPVTKDSKT